MKQGTKNFVKIKKANNENRLNQILEYIDSDITNVITNISDDYKNIIEEIRLRVNKPLIINMMGDYYLINKNGDINRNSIDGYIVTKKNIEKTFQMICNYSVYAFEEDLKKGFITIKGGHRVGVSGKAIYNGDKLEKIKEISSLNIRIAREILGASNKLISYVIKKNNSIYNTLIVSPPQCGKTTLLRDLIRNISNGVVEYNFKGLKVGVVDERSEISGVYKGIPQNEVGIRTDILDGCKKYDGMIILIRSMSPDVIATDELGGVKDINALHEALKAGVKIIATVHGEDIKDIKTKPNLKRIIKERIFERIVILDNSKGVGTIKDIVNGKTFISLINKEGNNDVSIKNNRKSDYNSFM